MKAMLKHAKALLYLPEGTDARPLTAVFEKQAVQVRLLHPEDLGHTLGFLAGRGGNEAPTAENTVPPKEPFLVLCDCTSSSLGKILAALRAPELPPLPLKATLTPTNTTWTARQLYEEICKEHAVMNGTASTTEHT